MAFLFFLRKRKYNNVPIQIVQNNEFINTNIILVSPALPILNGLVLKKPITTTYHSGLIPNRIENNGIKYDTVNSNKQKINNPIIEIKVLPLITLPPLI